MAAGEIAQLTLAMTDVGERLQWNSKRVLDKHCVGGLAGNRTTPIVVAIIAACGGLIPKTSSRAITSPSGTADSMEMLAPVNLSLAAMRAVVEPVPSLGAHADAARELPRRHLGRWRLLLSLLRAERSDDERARERASTMCDLAHNCARASRQWRVVHGSSEPVVVVERLLLAPLVPPRQNPDLARGPSRLIALRSVPRVPLVRPSGSRTARPGQVAPARAWPGRGGRAPPDRPRGC